MKSKKATAFTIAGFLLAIAIAVSSYFLFYKKAVKNSREITRESSHQLPVPGKAVEDSVPDNSETAEEIIEQEVSTTPIPFVVKTDSIKTLPNSVQIISKSYHLPSKPDCENYFFSWQEIKLPDKQITTRLNKALRAELKPFEELSEDGSGIPAEYCNGKAASYKDESYFEGWGRLVLFGHLLHATCFHRFHIPGTRLGTSCYDIRTGKKVNFRQLIKSNRMAELDSMIVTEPATMPDGKIHSELAKAFRKQLPDLDFEFTKKGLVVYVNEVSHEITTNGQTLDLDMKETAYFLKPEIFEMVYKKHNSFSR